MNRITKTYQQVQSDLRRYESFFVNRGMDPDEAQSEVGFQFTRFARRGLDPERVRRRVYSALRDLERKRLRHPTPLPLPGDPPAPDFNLKKLLTDLGEDAQILVKLALEEASRLGVIGRVIGLNWTMTRVRKAWAEIREALS